MKRCCFGCALSPLELWLFGLEWDLLRLSKRVGLLAARLGRFAYDRHVAHERRWPHE